MRPIAIGLWLLLSAGCSQSNDTASSHGCVADNPPSTPFDVGDVHVPSRPADAGLPQPAPETAESIAALCSAEGGSRCDATRFISKNAAACVAASNDMQPGLAAWNVALSYHPGHHTVIWNVSNRLEQSPEDGYRGELLAIDATTGTVLGTYAYAVIP